MSEASESVPGPNNGGLEPERRNSQRIPLEAIVHYKIADSEFINMSSNISVSGIFIKNFSPPPVGTEVKIKVNLPRGFASTPVQLMGKVIRVVDGVGLKDRGMGVEFTSIQADTRDAIRFFVNEIYEVEDLERLTEPTDDQQSFQYTPGPEDTLRIRPVIEETHDSEPDSQRDTSKKLLWGILLVFVGIFIGGGLVLAFFLGQ